ncbi:3' 5' exonuclease [Fusarium tjaetaba]|uniref:3' 5' exonuclease n=1 Tax=Fusarium tjaetaba TaxID=1567544 RepID=A0A8H5QXW1_9HYPO|nr:3' 5' exonuclease [Fusarium tjaetaba]KAF5623292.1 3' 5' exonuclease [Fusarium tjaetaba]
MASSTSTNAAGVISSLTGLKDFIDSIPESATLYLDLEGNNLSRNGTITIITILVRPTEVTKLIDVQTLGSAAFTTPATGRKTLKAVLEDPLVSKCLWDVRNDADALWVHYKVRLAGVTDIQLLENASRYGDKTYVRGLHICVEEDLKLEILEFFRWSEIKRLFKTRMADDIFSRRPLDAVTKKYCINDVVYLPALQATYTKRMDSRWMKKVMDESARRVVEACSPDLNPQPEKNMLKSWALEAVESGMKSLELGKTPQRAPCQMFDVDANDDYMTNKEKKEESYGYEMNDFEAFDEELINQLREAFDLPRK